MKPCDEKVNAEGLVRRHWHQNAWVLSEEQTRHQETQKKHTLIHLWVEDEWAQRKLTGVGTSEWWTTLE